MPSRLLPCLLFVALVSGVQAAVAPQSVENLCFSTRTFRYTSARQTVLQTGAEWYDILSKSYSGGLTVDRPLQTGTYTYEPGEGNKATLTLFVSGGKGGLNNSTTYALAFTDSREGTVDSFGTPFSFTEITDQAYASNMSSRSLVSRDTPSIAGFIIAGAMPRLCLVRAIGPTLTKYGVTAAVPDVALELHSQAGILAANDDWSASDPAPLESAFRRCAAFPLERGSKDAAILVVLPPGNYTALARSANLGETLVEVYLVP